MTQLYGTAASGPASPDPPDRPSSPMNDLLSTTWSVMGDTDQDSISISSDTTSRALKPTPDGPLQPLASTTADAISHQVSSAGLAASVDMLALSDEPLIDLSAGVLEFTPTLRPGVRPKPMIMPGGIPLSADETGDFKLQHAEIPVPQANSR